ncbi:Uncharacterized protein YoxC, contains an MCP-like domain [Atopostipes suicloacalis DSM 15692]|uniref:Uncharacterized protein YoxC, contains an MCP-like domain n=1 Tax=Atopostipes suicloacalis DSM 15692 TaxID=1121025 RepID=A0A1M4X7X1_9LACT|nr:hypothetical protein [Atopostipes suicloacalis]SHE89495.1 Uncharacterized protein YoxC, contains an MCP-like domain [Atopostipes suicloacalis DSM 15692]
MSTGTIIAISIVVISILALIIVGIMTYKKIKPTLKNVDHLKEVINQKTKYYTRESQHLNERITLLTQRVDGIQSEVEVKMVDFEDFTDEKGEFQSSLRYLQSHAGEYTKGISSNIMDEVKEDGPQIIETFKRAFKKTAQKQKIRHQK